MKNIFLITKREYLTQVQKKSFVVLTLMGPLLLFLFAGAVVYMFQANRTHYNIAVADKTEVFSQLSNTDDISFQYISADTESSVKESLKDSEALDGLLVIEKPTAENWNSVAERSMLYTNKKIGFDSRQEISDAIADQIRKEKIRNLGVDEAQIADLNQKFTLPTENVKDSKKGDDALVFGVKSALGSILMYVTFMFIIMYGVRVMRSVLEEKNNRVVEIIISSVKPFELMMGKIFGVTLVALTQFGAWISMTIIAALVLDQKFGGAFPAGAAENGMQANDMLQTIGTISHSLLALNYFSIISVFIFFFLFGYIFYSAMYAAVGSAVDNETETQQFTLFAIVPLTLGLYGGFSIMNNPDGPLAFWLSMVPLTSPVGMVARIPFGVPAWQILLSFALLLGSALLMIWVAGKVYRVGILTYGNKPSLKEVMKWIKG